MTRKTPLLLAPLAFVILVGCPPGVINIGYTIDTSTGTTTSTSATTSSTGSGGLCTPGATQPCYDGPAGTEGHGICRAGTQACAADGASWGTCTGEVLPQPENCASGQDQDCDGKVSPCKGTLRWARSFGDAATQTSGGVAVDGADGAVIVGAFAGAIDFGGGPLTSAGGTDVFVTKLDASSGDHIWSKRFGDAGDQRASAVAVDAAGHVLVTGTFAGSVDFGGGPLVSVTGFDVFVVALDAAGEHVWSKSFATAQYLDASALSVDPSGDVLVTGNFVGTIDFGGGPLTSAGGRDLFVLKLKGSTGQHVWSKRAGDSQYQTGSGVATDSAGNVFLVGDYSGSLDLGDGALTAVDAAAIGAFLAKLDKAGGSAWSKSTSVPGDVHDHYVTNVVVGSDGAPIMAGYFGGAIDLGHGQISTKANSAVFLAKFDAAGSPVWSGIYGTKGDQGAAGLALDAHGNVILSGGFQGQIDFGGGPVAALGGGDAFLVKLDVHGSHVWSKRFGDDQAQAGIGVSADSASNVILVGNFSGTIDFGGGVQAASAGNSDVFVASFEP
jgi:hypothetical protein